MSTTRQQRVQELLVHEISDIVRREMRDPRLGFVTITDAEVTPDLRHARVYFSVLGDAEQQAQSATALNRASKFVRGEFARRAQMRYVPDIKFEYDPSAVRAARISELLEQVREDDEHGDGSPVDAAQPGGGPDPQR